jgi:hypothetical protein
MYSQEKAWHSERNLAPRQFQPQKFIMSEPDCLETEAKRGTPQSGSVDHFKNDSARPENSGKPAAQITAQ